MARDWKSLFTNWAKPPSDTEEEKADRAARMIREAINEFEPLKSRGTQVYGTGSYKNNTNARFESDIDVAVVLTDAFFAAYPPNGKKPQASDLGHGKGVSYGLRHFRDDVGRALVKKFGADGVTPGSKAFDVHSNTVRLDADVAVFLNHRRYTGEKNADGTWHYLEGVEMRDRDDTRIINWHAQHYDNGVSKNRRTSRRYKCVVRILKRLRDDMQEQGETPVKAASKVPSFLLECLAYNAGDGCYGGDHLYDDVKAVIGRAWTDTKPGVDADLVEVSGLKWLFSASQPWTQAEAHEFLLRAWNHVGFKQ